MSLYHNNDSIKIQALNIWLKNKPMPLEEQMRHIKQVIRQPQEIEGILQSFVIPNLLSSENDLTEDFAIELFRDFVNSDKLFASKQVLFDALFAVLRTDVKRDRLIEAAKFTGRERGEFVVRYGERALPYFYRSTVTMGLYAAAAAPSGGLSFAEKQRLLACWLERALTVDELERILAASQLQAPPANGMNGQQFASARGRGFPLPVDEQGWFLDTWGAKCVTFYRETAPERFEGSTLHTYVKSWLSHFPVADFERKQSSTAMLLALTGLPTSKYGDLNEIVKAWIAFKAFIEAPVKLSQAALTDLGKNALRVLFLINNPLTPTELTRQSLYEKIASAIVPGIRDEVTLAVMFALLVPYTTAAQRESILHELCREAGAVYAQTKDFVILLPYIKAIPIWDSINLQNPKSDKSQVDQVDYDRIFKLWRLLFPISISLRTLEQIQQEISNDEKSINWDNRISIAWSRYTENLRRSLPPAVVANAGNTTTPAASPPVPVPPQPPQPVAPLPYAPPQMSLPPQPMPLNTQSQPSASAAPQPSPSADKALHARWWTRIVSVWWMNRALKNTDAKHVARLTGLWKAHSDTISSKQGEFSQVEWERLQLARDFYVACDIADEQKSEQDQVRYPYERDILKLGEKVKSRYPQQNRPGGFLNDEQYNRFLIAEDFVKSHPGPANGPGSNPNLPSQPGQGGMPGAGSGQAQQPPNQPGANPLSWYK